jgi:tRNA threonylcarbamoyladenosine biosynthesis protein TsaE
MQNFKKTVHTIQDLAVLAKELSTLLPANCILLLSGPMAAGKTEFVSQLALIHHCQRVASPTFALHHHYQGDVAFDHWDLYRIEGEDELESTGFWDQLQNSKSWVLIEWPEKLNTKYLPKDRLIVRLQIQPVGSLREISVSKFN